MRNIYAKILLIVFILQMVAQIALTTDMYPYSNVLTPNKEKSSSLSKNPSSNINQNTNNSQINQLNNKTNSQNNQINNRNANSSITSETSIKSDQSTQSTSSSSSNPPASIDNFKYKENITLDYTKFSSSFYNYPLMLNIVDNNLKTYAKSDGSDIAFFGTDYSLLSYSMISYFSSTGSLNAWVNIPYVSSSVDTVFYMAYGNQSLNSYQNETAVWNSNYYTVLHLNEISGTTVYDATANGNNGQKYGTSAQPGIVDNGQVLSGSTSSYITDSANPSGSVTIGFWFKLANTFSSSSSYSQILLTKYISDNTNMHVILKGQDYYGGTGSNYDGSLSLKVKNSYGANYQSTSQTTWYSNTWYYIVIVINSVNGANKIYVNGVSDTYAFAGSGYGNLPNTNNFVLGGGSVDSYNLASVTSNNYLNGELDEFWIMSGTQSSSYISTTYNNLKTPSSFVKSIGSQENNYPTIAQSPSVLGVNDSLENGHPVLWAMVNDGWHHPTSSVTMKINSATSTANYSMSFNGTMWILTSFLPQYAMFYNYQVINASDGFGHYLPQASEMLGYNFSNDKVAPTILDFGYNPTEGANGTFWTKATDNWGIISKVILNVTQCDCQIPKGTSAVIQMAHNETMYFVNWLIMGSDVNINYNITVSDLAGNTMTTPSTYSYVANKAPWVTNVTINSFSFTANDNLYVSYTYHDYDNNLESGTVFNWYENGILQTKFNYTNVIDKSYLQFGQTWYVVVIPGDGITLGTPNSSSTITLNKAVPLITSLSITSNPKTSDNLSVNWVFYDADKLNMTGYNVTWYINGVYDSFFNNMTNIYHGYTKLFDL